MSVRDDEEQAEYTTDPELIHEKYNKKVALVIDAGFGGDVPSTVVNCVDDELEVIREGKGILKI